MRTLSILERKSIGGGLSSAGIKSQLGGYGAMPNGEGGGMGGGGLAGNVAGTFTFAGNGSWTNLGNGISVNMVCTPGTTFGFTLGLSTSGKLVNAQTGLDLQFSGSCTVTTINTKTGIETICPTNGGTCTVIDTKTGQKLSDASNSFFDQSGFSTVSIGEGSEVAMGGSDLAGGYVSAGSYGDYGGFGGFGLGGDN
jgi:hypothetical protein